MWMASDLEYTTKQCKNRTTGREGAPGLRNSDDDYCSCEMCCVVRQGRVCLDPIIHLFRRTKDARQGGGKENEQAKHTSLAMRERTLTVYPKKSEQNN